MSFVDNYQKDYFILFSNTIYVINNNNKTNKKYNNIIITISTAAWKKIKKK